MLKFKTIIVLLTLLPYISALLTAIYLLAKAKYLSMDFTEAEQLLESCIDKSDAPPEAHLLMAQVE